jgi:hypothetical protein
MGSDNVAEPVYYCPAPAPAPQHWVAVLGRSMIWDWDLTLYLNPLDSIAKKKIRIRNTSTGIGSVQSGARGSCHSQKKTRQRSLKAPVSTVAGRKRPHDTEYRTEYRYVSNRGLSL